MQRFRAGEEEAFLHAEACELAVLSSVLHTLSVELSVPMDLHDSERLDGLVAEATRLLAREGRQDAITVLQATSSRLRDVASSQASHRRGACSEYPGEATL